MTVEVSDADLFTDRDPDYVATPIVSTFPRPTMAIVHEGESLVCMF